MNQKLSFGEPFLETRLLAAEESYTVEGSVILVNIDTDSEILVNGEYHLPSMQAMIVKDVSLSIPGKALIVKGADTLDLNDRQTLLAMTTIWKSNYQLTGLPQHKGVPYIKSPQITLGNVSVNFCLVGDPDCPSGIHCEHGGPVKELHVQIAGLGAVDLMKSADSDSCYASLPLAPGSTHIATWAADGVYPWHRYRSISRSLFLAVSAAV